MTPRCSSNTSLPCCYVILITTSKHSLLFPYSFQVQYWIFDNEFNLDPHDFLNFSAHERCHSYVIILAYNIYVEFANQINIFFTAMLVIFVLNMFTNQAITCLVQWMLWKRLIFWSIAMEPACVAKSIPQQLAPNNVALHEQIDGTWIFGLVEMTRHCPRAR